MDSENFISILNDLHCEAKLYPLKDDFRYLRGFPKFFNTNLSISDKSIDLINRLGKLLSLNKHTLSKDSDEFETTETLQSILQDAIDRCNVFIDEITGKRKDYNGYLDRDNYRLSSIIPKPQLNFSDKIDNSTNIFIPIIRDKPNALEPLPDYSKIDILKVKDSFEIPHPYELEIKSLKYLPQQIIRCKESLFLPLENTLCHWIENKEQLILLKEHLDTVSEFAIDLEHHNFRSFQGFTCLMQISTRCFDYLIDTLELRSELYLLNSSFTNPKIVKVLHGSNSDILWLQRDFGLYLVNLFDTGQAARCLEFKSFKLLHLLYHYCNVKTDKKYQLADWRVRPISAAMLQYAREDTHYLLYIYDRMKNELIDRSNKKTEQNIPLYLFQVLNCSNKIALSIYCKPKLPNISEFLFHRNLELTQPQLYALQKLFEWKDRIARSYDESYGYVLPNRLSLHIVQYLPENLSSTFPQLPPFVTKFYQDIQNIIREVKSLQSSNEFKRSENSFATPIDIEPRNVEELCDKAGWLPIKPILSANPQHSLFIESFSDDEEPIDDDEAALIKKASILRQEIEAEVPTTLLPVHSSKARDYTRTPKMGNIASPSPPNLDTSEAVDPSLPHSFAQIYKLSNTNKRKQKQSKKKQKLENIDKDINSGSNLSDKDFMSQLGWQVNKVLDPVQEIVPFDYSSAIQALPSINISTPPTQKYSQSETLTEHKFNKEKKQRKVPLKKPESITFIRPI